MKGCPAHLFEGCAVLLRFAGPRVAKLLNTWIWAMHEYAQVMKPITPRIDKLHKMEKELEKLYEEKKELDKSKPSS